MDLFKYDAQRSCVCAVKGGVPRQNTARCLGTWRAYCPVMVFCEGKCVIDILYHNCAICVTNLIAYTPLLDDMANEKHTKSLSF